MAAAQVTLDVIRDEDLLGNSARVGAFLRAELAALAARYQLISDVRGSGLYLGVELVRDRGTRDPDPAAATAVVNGLRERRVLISATGEHGNVLKIRPPLVFAEADAARLLTELDAVLAALPA
jgi:4-aminobutyrate aminotransferase-like enzyme